MSKLEQLPYEFYLQADYGECCIWLEDGGSSLNLFDVSDAIKSRAEKWVSNYFEDEQSPAGQTREKYNNEGLEIAKSFKTELEENYTIIYRYFEGTTSNSVWHEIKL